VRKVGFLEVVIEPEKIKMEEEKVKDIGLANSQKSQGYTEVFGTSQSLLVIHQEFHIHS